jgi:hypothetical protein
MLKMALLRSSTFTLSKDSLVVTRSVGGTYEKMGGQLLSCFFLHLGSFNPLGLLRTIVILACCQSVIPSTSLLSVDLGGTCRNRVACVIALENLQRAKVLVLDSNIPIPHVLLVGWPGTEKNWLLKNALLDKSRVLNSKCPECFAWEGVS